jgi:hypothetical protein
VASVGKPLRAGLRWARPLAMTLVSPQLDTASPGEVVVADVGAASESGRVAAVLETRRAHAGRRDLLVGVAARNAPNDELARIVGDHRRAGGDALIVVVGSAVERRLIERELRGDPDVGISVMLMVDALGGAELERVRRRVASMIVGRRALQAFVREPLAREPASLKPDIARHLERRAAVRVGVRAALTGDAQRVAAGMKASHVQLATDTASMADANFEPKTVGLVAALGLMTPVWRAGVGRLTALVPFTRTVVRGGLAYAITRLVGMGAQRLAMHGRKPHQEER